MSLLDPPAFSRQSRANKRKQPPASDDEDALSSQQLAHNSSINPLSHTPGLVRQLATAGLTVTDEDLSTLVPDFPHRGLDRGAKGGDVESDSDVDGTDADTDVEGGKQKKKKKTQDPWRGGHYEVLLQSVQQFLDRGDVNKAARAYGLLLQLRPGGHPVDIKRHNLWAIGAEILMREGEKVEAAGNKPDHDQGGECQLKRWGRAANINKVKAYFDTLIQQHPYDYKHPRAVCAADFWIAMLSCEIYNVHTEHIMALDRVAKGDALDSFTPDNSFENDEPEARATQQKEELRLRALMAMRDITKRMDELMQDPPYSKNVQFLRLRAMASLYVADLVIPLTDTSPHNIQGAQRARQTEQTVARGALKKIVTNGGELDGIIKALLHPSNKDVRDIAMALYSSLPIRGL